MIRETVTKTDLVNLGYGPGQAKDIIHRAKCSMVLEGYEYYNNIRLGRVPTEAVEKLLGIKVFRDGGDRKMMS